MCIVSGRWHKRKPSIWHLAIHRFVDDPEFPVKLANDQLRRMFQIWQLGPQVRLRARSHATQIIRQAARIVKQALVTLRFQDFARQVALRLPQC